MTKNYKIKSA